MSKENSIALEIFKNISLTKEEAVFISNLFERIELQKGDSLLQPNCTVENQFYVHSGCLRSYFIHPSGKDHTIQFAINDWWISDYTSFFTAQKSVMNIECLQDAVLYKLSRKNMETLCQTLPKIETFFRYKLEKAFAHFQKRILDYLSLSASERYHDFILAYPTITQYIKNYHVASYLGITTESLSRIRKTIS